MQPEALCVMTRRLVVDLGVCCPVSVQVTSYKLAMANAAEAVNGPSVGDGSLPLFSWEGKWAGVAHKGMPTVFDFKFELQRP